MDLFKGSIPQDDQIMNLPLDTDRTRGDNPVRNPLELTGMTGPGPMSLLQREVSTVAKGSRAQIVLTEPRRCQATGVEVEGTVTDTRANIPYRCCDCGIRMTTGHNSVTTGPGPMSLLQREVSTVAKGSRAQIVLTEPRRCQATGVEVEGTVTDTRANIPYRCCDCGIRMTTGHNSVTTEDKDKEPGPIRTYPVKTECAPIGGGDCYFTSHEPFGRAGTPVARCVFEIGRGGQEQ